MSAPKRSISGPEKRPVTNPFNPWRAYGNKQKLKEAKIIARRKYQREHYGEYSKLWHRSYRRKKAGIPIDAPLDPRGSYKRKAT